jgi:hypothetical protein
LAIFITRASASVVLTRSCSGPDFISVFALPGSLGRFFLLLLQLRQLRDGLLQPFLLFLHPPFLRC